jgi:hypothetical protein
MVHAVGPTFLLAPPPIRPARFFRRDSRVGALAHEHLTAPTMYREMEMLFWLEQAEVEVKGPK